MASVDLVAVVGVACFGVGIVFGAILVMAVGIRAEGQLAWRQGTATLRDDPDPRGDSARPLNTLRDGPEQGLSSAA